MEKEDRGFKPSHDNNNAIGKIIFVSIAISFIPNKFICFETITVVVSVLCMCLICYL